LPRFLLGITHPRRLEFFTKSVEKIDFIDKAFAENMPSSVAYKTLRDFALDKGYDYLILTADDVVVSDFALKQIVKAILFHDYPITTGWSLVRPNMKIANITLFPPKDIEKKIGKPILLHEYGFIPTRMIEDNFKRDVYVLQVWFVGFSLTAVRRDVLRDWEVRGWFFNPHPIYQPEEYEGRRGFWSGFDLWFSFDSWRKGYRKLCVLDAYVPHLPVGYSHGWRELRVGKEPANLRFEEAKKPMIL